jgi:threonine dehydrogenase-like Zn-dependent dehydrogenase
VFGAGPVGLLCAYSAFLRGASKVYVVDHVQERLNKAKAIGAIPINFTQGNAAAQILKRDPDGVNRSCDCCGYECLNEKLEPQQNAILNDAVRVTSFGGGIGVVGAYFAQEKSAGRPNADSIAPSLDFPISEFWGKSLSMKSGTVDTKPIAGRLVDLVKSGRAKLGFIVSSVIGIEEAPEAYEKFNEAKETKVVIRFPWMQGEEDNPSNGYN